MPQTPTLYYSEYRTGNCTMIEADTAEEAAVEAEDFARAYQTRVAFTRVATPEDIESFSGRVYKVSA